MANVKPFKDDGGVQKEFSSTDTIPPNNLAPGGSDGYVLTKDSGQPDGQKWAPSSSTGGDIAMTKTAPTSTQVIPAGYGGIAILEYEIVDGTDLEIAPTGQFEIT